MSSFLSTNNSQHCYSSIHTNGNVQLLLRGGVGGINDLFCVSNFVVVMNMTHNCFAATSKGSALASLGPLPFKLNYHLQNMFKTPDG
jgi:hypothetical protein